AAAARARLAGTRPRAPVGAAVVGGAALTAVPHRVGADPARRGRPDGRLRRRAEDGHLEPDAARDPRPRPHRGDQGPGRVRRQPREPPRHSADPRVAPGPAQAARRGRGGRRLLLRRPLARDRDRADVQRVPDRAARRRTLPGPGVRAARGRMEPAHLPRGHPVAGRLGAALRCREPGVPAVPLVLRGTYQAMPRGGFWPKRGRPVVSVRYGRPMVCEPDESTGAFNGRLEDEVGRLWVEHDEGWWASL